MRADMTVYQPGDFLYNLLIKKSKYVIMLFKRHCSFIVCITVPGDEVFKNFEIYLRIECLILSVY